MHYTLTATRIEIRSGSVLIAFIEPAYFDHYPYFKNLFDNYVF
jgi:hypothetical protein